MKSTYILPLLALAIPPALSHPGNAPSDNTLDATLESRGVDTVPFACTQTSSIIEAQFAEIIHLQANQLPVPADLAGYFYAVARGRRAIGCPALPNLSKRGLDPLFGDPCKALHVQYAEIVDQIYVFKNNSIPIPPYVAGIWSAVQDGNKALGCGLPNPLLAKGNSTKAINSSE